MKVYSILFIITSLLMCAIYITNNERKIKNLQQENLIYEANLDNDKIEIENYNTLIFTLQKQLKANNILSQQKHQALTIANQEIQNMNIEEQIQVINNVFTEM